MDARAASVADLLNTPEDDEEDWKKKQLINLSQNMPLHFTNSCQFLTFIP
jgi:hypothetical protein